MPEKKEKTLLAKQRQWIFVCLVLCAVLFPALFIVNIIFEDSAQETTKPTVGPHGEMLSADGLPFIFNPVEKENIEEIIIDNQHGTTRIYRGDDGDLYVDGAEDLYYNAEKMAQLYVNCRYMLSYGEAENADTTNFEMYGLSDEHYQAKVRLTARNGDVFVVYIGDYLSVYNAYYARLEGRDAIYLLDATIKEDLLADIKDVFSPILTTGTDTNTYYLVDNFQIKHNGSSFIEIKTFTEAADKTDPEAIVEYSIQYPTKYIPSSERYDAVLQALISLQGEKVLEYNLDELDETALHTKLEEYGFFDKETGEYCHELSYDFKEKKTTLYFSAVYKDEKDVAYYNVYSPAFHIIVNIRAEAFPYLTWGMLNFVEGRFMMATITDFDTILFESKAVTANFRIHAKKDEKDRLIVDYVEVLSSNVPIAEGSSDMRVGRFDETNTLNFQRLYTGTLYMSIYDYGTMPENTEPMLTITRTTREGEETVYRFYRSSSLYCFFTVNGVGEFCVSYDYVQKIISNTRKVMYSELVDYGNLD